MKKLVVAVFLMLLFMPTFFFVKQVQAEPTLLEIFTYLGFANVSQVNLETLPIGKYIITLYAEFAGYHATNELSYYQTGTTNYNIIFTGPEGNDGYVVPPIVKTFAIDYEFGISFWVGAEGHRYFTQNGMNPDGQIHCQVYQNLDTPSMYLIGFENLYGAGDRDYQDMVVSIQLQNYLDVVTPYSTPGGEGWYNNGTYAQASLTEGLVDHGNGTRRIFTGWSGDASGTNYAGSNPILMDSNKTAIANWKTQYYLTVSSPYGSPVPLSGWIDAGTPVTASVNSPVPGAMGTRYVCTGWIGSGSVPPSGTGTSTSFTMYAPSNITWNWKTQYLLTVSTDPSGLTPQPTRNPAGETGSANSWWYDASSAVVLNAQTIGGHVFDYWDVDSISKGNGTNPITVTMDSPHTTTVHYNVVPPLAVSINPTSATIQVGQSVGFLSNTSGGVAPYSYQWYLNSNPVLGANSSSWIFTPTAPAIDYVFLEVKDSLGAIVRSETARVEVIYIGVVGGYSVPYALLGRVSGSLPAVLCYSISLLAFCGVLSWVRRKRE